MLDRRTTVTRLAEGVDATGRLSDEALGASSARSPTTARRSTSCNADATIGVLTSAVRDAANGEQFVARVRDVYGIDARVIPGEEEARLTFRGATVGRADIEHVAVVDIGGGSTEIVTGGGFRTSLQMGVVRFSERYLHHDPPADAELQDLTQARARDPRRRAAGAHRCTSALIAVAGTATTAAAIAHDVEPYDPDKVHGAHIAIGDLEEILARLAILPDGRAPRGPRPAPRPGADDRRRHRDPAGVHARVRPRRAGDLRARPAARRGARGDGAGEPARAEGRADPPMHHYPRRQFCGRPWTNG